MKNELENKLRNKILNEFSRLSTIDDVKEIINLLTMFNCVEVKNNLCGEVDCYFDGYFDIEVLNEVCYYNLPFGIKFNYIKKEEK